ncbi:hypothetical protein [Kitasatospora sp. GAS204B]|nr:hypothetical protein [Kitasatospora sp. GAS204B]MDH6118407.1 hypothetical protein [Kitasatospora sp. GAS204B]
MSGGADRRADELGSSAGRALVTRARAALRAVRANGEGDVPPSG